jgi:integral membrane protein (TIGR00529 family)
VTEILKLILVIAVIVFLIRKKWKLGYIMLLASLLLGVAFGVNPKEIGKNFLLGLIDPATLNLIGIIIGVYFLSSILRRIKSFDNLVNSLQQLVKDYRLILAFIPALLGMIPMPAGAMFSAPMVKAIGEKANLNPEEITFVNYWFRHVWEFVLPILPGMILFAGILDVPFRNIFLVQSPLTVLAIIVGLIWEYKYLSKNDVNSFNKKNLFFNIKKLFLSIWSILTVIILVIIVKINVLFSLIFVIFILFMINYKKLGLHTIHKIIRSDIDLNVIILIASIMIFQRMLQVSGAAEIIPKTFMELGVHPFIILFFIPFFLAMITGLTPAAIGLGIPILLPIIMPGEINYYYAMFAFSAVFAGSMLSPMHLCLVVTRNYFKSDLNKIYKMLILPLSAIVLSAFILLLLKG